ncbi:E3 ubiquitin-protein ligase RNF138-like [Colossoma macropomum]|uniref:E3 ubiquitin-protein ligase RNF138-like n=1 Tax=Colossoma macropomum TaxID=42526 RepID=UPI001863BE63|nr:E3 ubiquitin-protein ligase RNF138-like [Colossoma macropomum]
MGNCCSVTSESCAVTQTSNTDADEDYDCPICQDIYSLPVCITSCRHVFCKTCLETAVQSLGPRCPVCRTFVSERPQRATDVQERMRKKKGKCRACGKKKLLSQIRLHYESCKKYKKEYGLITDPAPLTPAQTQDNTGIMPNVPLPTSRTSGLLEIALRQPNAAPQGQRAGRVYPCPFCPLEELSNTALVQHCTNQHAGEMCPICMSILRRNTRYSTHNFVADMLRRHSYSYADYMNEEEDEEGRFRQALQTSAQEF